MKESRGGTKGGGVNMLSVIKKYKIAANGRLSLQSSVVLVALVLVPLIVLQFERVIVEAFKVKEKRQVAEGGGGAVLDHKNSSAERHRAANLGRLERHVWRPSDGNNESAGVIISDIPSCVGQQEHQMGPQEARLAQQLARHYRLDGLRVGAPKAMQDARGGSPPVAELPKPMNVSVLIISWYPPILKLSWNLDELSAEETNKLDFYERAKVNQSGDFDLDMALDESAAADKEEEETSVIRELRRRRLLVRKSLTCFQVTYNVIESRFKVIEEYPPYLRSVLLERLAPATEYSLRVAAVYLGRERRQSARVQFVSPTDNESRRFKENTYRPVHRYPDERIKQPIGLGQVRGEELTIVAIALLFWLATICLFFNKWGKIRMLEPYQPAYRGSSSASFAQHHHPSIHNGGPATKLSSLAGGSVERASQLDSTSLTAARGSLDKHQQQAAETAPAATVAAKLLVGQRRLLSAAETLDRPHLGQRTYAELNYLFQSKAQVLAKATSLWNRQQQQQLQYRAQLAVSHSSAKSASRALRSQQTPGLRPAGRRAATQRSLDTPSEGTQSLGNSRQSQPNLGRGRSVSTSPRGQLMRQFHQSRTSDLPGSLECAPEEPPASASGTELSVAPSSASNKLRRLLFMNKSHQHQHIATSTSSSTLTHQAALRGRPFWLASASLDCSSSSADSQRLSRAAREPHSASSSSLPEKWHRPEHAARPAEHHILIEPPSPPPSARNLPAGGDPSELSVDLGQLAGEESCAACRGRLLAPDSDEGDWPGGFKQLRRRRRPGSQDCMCRPASQPTASELDGWPRLDEEPERSDAFAKLARHCNEQWARNQSMAALSAELVCDSCRASMQHVRWRQHALEEQEEEESIEGPERRSRVSSVFVASPYSRAHRDSFAMLRALSQKKSKSAEDVAYLSSLVLRIWARDRNPLLQSVSQQQLRSSNKPNKASAT